MNLYNIFEGIAKTPATNTVADEKQQQYAKNTAAMAQAELANKMPRMTPTDRKDPKMGMQEDDPIGGALVGSNGVAAIQGTDNDISPIGSNYEYEDDENVTEDNPHPIDEAAMNPSAFAQAIASGAEQGVLVGFEFETLIPAATVSAWKNGPTTAPAGYDPASIAWIEGKTTTDLFDGIARAYSGNSSAYERVFDDLFKYKSSVATTEGFKSVWGHYRQWAAGKVREELDALTGVNPVIAALKELLKDREFSNTEVSFMDNSGVQRYATDAEGNPVAIKAKPFVIRLLKEKTGVDFSGRVKKSELTPEVINKIKEAMQEAYRITRGPVDSRCSQVANAQDGRKDEIWSTYIPGYTYRVETSPEMMSAIKNHFAEFCTARMGTDKLKDLLKTKWAFRGRVNNTTETLKEKLWYYVTPGAAQPASLAPRSRYNNNSYMDGAEFLKANLKDAFGNNMVIFRNYHQESKKLDRWYIEPDGSLRPNAGDYAAEVVSPPLKADAAMAALRTWYQRAAELNLYTNSSTGLHINVSIPDKIDVLKLAVFSGDQYVLKQFGREDNSYARSVIKSLKGKGSLPTLGSETFKNAEKQMKELVRDISGDHFATVNFNGKYVSFRHAGGNYLGKAADIANTVGRFVRAMIIAADPTAYRDEYIGKLIKIMKQPEGSVSDKLGLTDIRAIADRGIPVQYIDFVATQGSNPAEAVSAAEAYAKVNYGANKVNVKAVPDPSARERLAADRGFSSVTKQHIETTAPENFFRLEIFPTTRRSLESFASRFSTYGADRGSAFGMYGTSHDKRAVGVTGMAAVKQTDPGFVDAVKALRGEASNPLPLPGTKAAPKAKAAKFASQRTAGQGTAAQQPAQAEQQYGIWHTRDNHWVENGYGRIAYDNPNAVRLYMNAHNLTSNNYEMRPIPASQQAQPNSDDDSEPAGTPQWELYHIPSGEAVTQNDRPVTFTADRLSHAQDAMATWMREHGMAGNGYNVRPVDDEERTFNLIDINGDVIQHYHGTLADTRRVAELTADRIDSTVHIVDNGRTVDTIAPVHDDDTDQSNNAQNTWTLNNGEMVRHYDPSQVNSARAFELAREFYSQYGHPVTISRDGVTYGHWPRQEDDDSVEDDGSTTYRFHDMATGELLATEEYASDSEAFENAQVLADDENVNVEVRHGAEDTPLRRFTPGGEEQRYTLDTNTAQRIVVARGEESVQRHALSMANELGETVRVLNAEGEVVATVAPAQRQGTEARPQFYRFMNPSNRNAVGAGYYDTDQEAEAHAQRIANTVRGEILLLGVTPLGPDRRLGTFQPQVNEARIFHPDEKVNVVYQPHNSTAKMIVAKAVDHIMAQRVIDSYVHRSQMNPKRAPVTAKDFVLNPTTYQTSEAQDGMGITGAGGSIPNDSTSPVGGGGVSEDDVMESRLYAMKRAGYDIL
jgi:hypothetical protein